MRAFGGACWAVGLSVAVLGCGGGGTKTQRPAAGSSAGAGGGVTATGGASGGGGVSGGGAGGHATGGAAGSRGTGGAAGSGGAGNGSGGSAGGGSGGSAGASGSAGAGGSGHSGGGGTTGGGGGAGPGGAAGSGCTTSVSGTIYDPAGAAPIYQARVYAPTAPLAAVPEGISCTACGTPPSGQPIATALTDIQGHFKLTGVPAGTNIPLVIQLGKWRRQITAPAVAACADRPLAATLTRLPRNSSEGHLPRIALVTGHADALDCWLRKLGIDDAEFTPETGTGRVHMFVGGNGNLSDEGSTQLASGAAFTDAYASLFADPTKLAGYDMVVLPCEAEQLGSAKDPYLANMKAYADGGGHVIAEHFESYWIRRGPAPWPSTAQWLTSVAPDLPSPLTASLDASTAPGTALATWMTNLGVVTNDQFSVSMAQSSVSAVVAPTQQWLTFQLAGTAPAMATPLALTFATPVEATSGPQCGRVDFDDIHADVGDRSTPAVPFPTGCLTTAVSGQERLLEYLFFATPTCDQP